MIRPTNMYYHEVPGCGGGTCTESIIGIGNPLIWWAASAAALYLVYRLARYREWQVGLVLTGLAAGYLPWLAYTNRTVFQFYSIAFEPYLILILALVAALILGKPADPTWRRQRGIAILAVYVVAVVLVSVFFFSVVSAQPSPPGRSDSSTSGCRAGGRRGDAHDDAP